MIVKTPTRAETMNASVLAFILLTIGIAIPVAGNLGVHLVHVLLIAASPFLLGYSLAHRYLRFMWLVMGLWFGSQILADLMTSGSPSSLVTIGPVVALTVSALHCLVFRYGVRPAFLMFSLGAGWTLFVLQDLPQLLATGNPWKYGLSSPVVLLVVGFVSVVSSARLLVVFTLGALAALSFISDSRISTVVLALAALLCLISSSRAQSRTRVLAVIGFAAAALVAVYVLYPPLALAGMFGERALVEQQGFEQSGANFLLGARKEFLQALYLIANNPLTGIGGYSPVSPSQSWAAIDFIDRSVAPLNVNDIAYLLFAEAGLGYHPHSQLLEAVLYAGIGSLPAWAFVVASAITLLVREVRGDAVMPGLQSYVALGVIWASLFSPFGTTTALSLSVALFLASLGAPSANAVHNAGGISQDVDSASR
jgi:hypothetical protein